MKDYLKRGDLCLYGKKYYIILLERLNSMEWKVYFVKTHYVNCVYEENLKYVS